MIQESGNRAKHQAEANGNGQETSASKKPLCPCEVLLHGIQGNRTFTSHNEMENACVAYQVFDKAAFLLRLMRNATSILVLTKVSRRNRNRNTVVADPLITDLIRS